MTVDNLLAPLREDHLPKSTVDIGRAIRVARRRRRGRWLAAAAAVIVVAALAAAPVLAGRGRAGLPATPDPGRSTEAPSGEFSPLRRAVNMDAVPGLTVEQYETARYWQRVMLRTTRGDLLDVTVYAPGRSATYGPGGVVRPASGAPARPVHGRPAYWLGTTLLGEPGPLLAWQWADDAWAFADAPNGQPRDLLATVANAVRPADEPVMFPFTMPLPAGYQPVGTSAIPDFPGTTVRLGTVDQADPHRMTVAEANAQTVSVSATAGRSRNDKGGVNRTVYSHPAVVADSTIVLFGYPDDFSVEVAGGRPDTERLIALAGTVRVLPHPVDESTWVDTPWS
jgi:hypothetical protein